MRLRFNNWKGGYYSNASPAVAKENGLAVGHQYWFAVPFAVPDMPIPHGSLPSGQLISSSKDMAHYLIALLNGGRYGDEQILSSAGIAELHRGVADFSAMGLSLGQYGMGWFVDEIGGTKLVWHGGTNPDFAAYMALLPEQKKGVVLLFNADHHWMNPVLSDFGGGVVVLHARLLFDRSDLRQLCVGMELFAHQAGPRGTEKVLLIMLGEGSTYDRQATYLN